MHGVGLAALPTSVSGGDGQQLRRTRVVATVRCAPPANKPLPVERDACFPWLVREVQLCRPSLRSVVALGSYAWDATLRAFAAAGFAVPRPKRKFGHGAEAELAPLADRGMRADRPSPASAGHPEDSGGQRPVLLVGSYHPSQQNTFTGKLTESMLAAVSVRAMAYAGMGPAGH